jgi:dihydroorotate dehydrogenase (NAD+) catalytic subunit
MQLDQTLFGVTFQNPIMVAAGTCGFGRELAEVLELDELGGIVTKSVTLEPRRGNAPPRVAEFQSGMLNSIGLTNPGLESFHSEKLPWPRGHLRRARVLVSVAGHDSEEYPRIVQGLDVLDIGETARAAEEAGADGLTLVNTMPGLLFAPAPGVQTGETVPW